MIGEKGDNRSVAKLYFLALSTAAQFLLIDTPLFFASLATNIFLVIYVIFMSDKFINLNPDNITNISKIVINFRRIFIFNLAISHIVLFYFVSTSIVNFLDLSDISFTNLSLELIYGILIINFCFLSPVVSEYFMNILDKDQPHRR
jgi:hypothetical protein